jgi:hypothetical protein
MQRIFLDDMHIISKIYENPSSEKRVVTWGQTGGQRDMKKPLVTFRNFTTRLKCKTHDLTIFA